MEFQNEVESLINNVDSPRELIDALNRRAYEAENSEHDDVQTLGRAYRNLADNIELLLNENRHIENNELANAIQGMEAEAPQRLPEQAQATPLRNLLQEATGQMAREPRIQPRREIGNDANQTTIYHADTVDQIAHWLTVEDSSSRRLFYGIVDEISQLPENQIKGAINTYINWARSSINDSDEHQLNNIDANGMNHVHAALKQLKELVNGNTIIDRRIDDIPEHNYMDILSYNGQGILDQAPRYVNGQTYIDNISQIENYLTNENSGSKQAFNSIVSELRTVAPDNILNAVLAQINYLEPRLNDENTMQTFGVDSVGGMRQLVRALAQLEELLNGRKALLPTNNPQGHKDGGIIRMANGGQTIAEKANEKLTEKEQSDAQSTAPFSLFGMTSPTDPRILEGSGLPPPDMGLLHVGHNQLFDNGNLSLGATGISMATPQGRINKLSGVDVGFEHPSGIYGRINKPIGGQSPRYEVGYRKSFADGGVANTQNSAVFDTMGNYAGMDTSMPTTQPTQTTQPKVDNFEQAMNVILPMEGGYNNVKGDSPTNYGIKQNTYSQYLKRSATVDDVRNMPIEHAKEIYRQNYWNPLQADSMDVKPAIVAFDAAVNQGLPFAKHIVKTTNGDIEKMLDMRQQRYNQSAKNPIKARFKKGWDNRLETIKNYALEDYYQDGGEVKKRFPTPEFQKLYEDMVLNAKPDPNTQTVNERLGRETVRLPQKPTVGLQPIGSGFGGSDGAKGTQLHLFEKKGGKVVSLAKMRAELNTRNR